MEFTMSAGSVPAGNYRATFLGAEPYRENLQQYGEGVLLKWRIVGGDHDGDEASRICSAKLSPKSALGKFAVAFAGRTIAPGERFSFATYVGQHGALIVEPTDNGGSRVATFLRDAPSQAPPPSAPATFSQQPGQEVPSVSQPTEQQAREVF